MKKMLKTERQERERERERVRESESGGKDVRSDIFTASNRIFPKVKGAAAIQTVNRYVMDRTNREVLPNIQVLLNCGATTTPCQKKRLLEG